MLLKHESLMLSDYIQIGSFVEGRAIVQFREPYQYMRKVFKDLKAFGFIDGQGEIITKDRYEKVWNFINGLAVVRHYENVYIIINKYGEPVAEAKYPRELTNWNGELMAIKTYGSYYITPVVRANRLTND